ncbi:MAG: hypothetical protein WCQ23_04285 [Candidatus Methanomethylophilaceae archaeon]|jgi:hypothetical protein
MTEVKKSTTWSGLGILALVLVLIAVVVYVALNPWILEDLLYVAIIVIVAIVIIAVIVALAMMLMAVPVYMHKGETYQNDTSYDINDVKPVMDKPEVTDPSNPDAGKKEEDHAGDNADEDTKYLY